MLPFLATHKKAKADTIDNVAEMPTRWNCTATYGSNARNMPREKPDSKERIKVLCEVPRWQWSAVWMNNKWRLASTDDIEKPKTRLDSSANGTF